MSDIIKSLRKRQKQIPYLYSPSTMEVYTPLGKVQLQLNQFPLIDIWSNPTLKFLDPVCKSGIYLSEIIIRLMEGLKEWEPDENKRHIHIITKMVFGYTYSKVGYRLTKKLLYGNYNCENIKKFNNVKELLSFLEEQIKQNVQFDIIIGNPPYNEDKSNKEKSMIGCSLWPDFVDKSLSLLKDSGYLSLIHPCGWRKPCALWKTLTVDNQIHYLEIHSSEDGQKTFNCGTRYDWYVLEKKPSYKDTTVRDETGNVSNIDLKKWNWFPHQFLSASILSNNNESKCNIIRSTDYRADKPYVSRTKTKKFQYPVALSLKDDEKRIIYSSKKLSHFGISKVICNCSGGSGGLYPYNDYDGEYGMNPLCFGLPITSREEGDEIVKALNTPKFKEFIESILWSGFGIHYKVFESLKKDFWKEFLNE